MQQALQDGSAKAVGRSNVLEIRDGQDDVFVGQILAVSNCVILEAFLIGIPLLSVLNVNTSAFVVVGCWIIAIAALTILVPLFWPKISAKNQNDRVEMPSSRFPVRNSSQPYMASAPFSVRNSTSNAWAPSLSRTMERYNVSSDPIDPLQ